MTEGRYTELLRLARQADKNAWMVMGEAENGATLELGWTGARTLRLRYRDTDRTVRGPWTFDHGLECYPETLAVRPGERAPVTPGPPGIEITPDGVRVTIPSRTGPGDRFDLVLP